VKACEGRRVIAIICVYVELVLTILCSWGYLILTTFLLSILQSRTPQRCMDQPHNPTCECFYTTMLVLVCPTQYPAISVSTSLMIGALAISPCPSPSNMRTSHPPLE